MATSSRCSASSRAWKSSSSSLTPPSGAAYPSGSRSLRNSYQHRLTRFPTESTCSNSGVMGWCSIAMNKVFSTMQMVMAKSTKGSMTIKFTISFSLIQYGWHSQIKNVLANLYQQGGHFLWDSSSSTVTKQNSSRAQPSPPRLLGLTLRAAETAPSRPSRSPPGSPCLHNHPLLPGQSTRGCLAAAGDKELLSHGPAGGRDGRAAVKPPHRASPASPASRARAAPRRPEVAGKRRSAPPPQPRVELAVQPGGGQTEGCI